VGRADALATIKRLLTSTRLLTLTGPGGVGKSRLALELAATAAAQWADGVWWVELGALCDAELVAHQVALALGMPEDPARSKEAALSAYLKSRELLLILDNCEHLAEACATLAQHLLETCPRLRILATSREPLGVAGETTWLVPPLALPSCGERMTVAALARSESGQLFLDRALAVQPDLRVTETVAAAIGRVCCQLDGLPLAIELAAARVRVLSVPQIAAHLGDRFGLLTGGGHTSLAHHQTLQAAMDWSYDLLSPPEQMLFERLSVFSGGYTLEAAEAVAGDPEGEPIAPAAVLDLLAHLVLKSLVQVVERGQTGYQMLETMRDYAAQRLAASGDRERMRERHLAYYLELARQAEHKLTGEDQLEWLKLLETEQENLRAALAWSEESGMAGPGLQLATALGAFWLRTGSLSEGRRWLERALAACREVAPARVQALYQAGRLAKQQGAYEQALILARKSLALSRRFRDRQGAALALGLAGRVEHWQGNREEAGRLLEDALILARASGDEATLARTLAMLSELLLQQGAHARAAELLEESLAIFERLADLGSMAWVYGLLGQVARLEGDAERASGHIILGLALCRELNTKTEIPFLLEALALVAADQGQLKRATQLWAAARAVRDSIYALLPPSYASDLAPHQDRVRAALGGEAFAAAWIEGLELSVDQALALAEGEPAARAPTLTMAEPLPPAPPPSPAYGLTPREVEVLRLVANGLSDAEIAGRLVISPRTVGKHLQSIYSKLYLPSRSAATRWAIEHHLD
jgi:non-specific serine/threonine protein kinase